ncbi:sulfotransferase 2B1-like [Myxocyprinus asiaticus]|uniref:sulfotransferase 2B1-like n=1 Tax=Myxocyprinus asiaticus TaxID=70543 RepID=UPI002222EB57|nr:sulfotransferase 2B1-like [Myxocyprinus asiaticus]XP_051581123.1 sulfotransferase 2B1-like [Myxocyprinus asiaticus]
MARLDITETFCNILFPGHMHTQDSLSYATNFKFQDTDTLIVTYPKSGTTWIQEIITLVLSKGDPTIAQTQPNWARAPWLEQYYCPKFLEASMGPRIITTHLPYHLLAPALQDSKAKVIYVARNPKDVVVSYYHFHKMANFLPDPGSFTEFLSAFLKGTVHYGSWFDHIKGWIGHAKDIQNFLYITYEEMWQDLHSSLEKVSCFLQCSLTEDELTSSQKHCSFNSMKENAMVNYTLIPQEIMDHSKGKFMRRGKMGDWKNMFTEEQSDHFDAVYSSQMVESSLLFKWERPEDALQLMITINTPESHSLREIVKCS